MKICVLNISVLILLSSVCFASGNTHPVSHRILIKQAAQSAISTAVEENNAFSFTAVSFLSDSSLITDLIRDDIVGMLLSKKITVFNSISSADTLITCSGHDAELAYGETFTESIFGARKVERTLSITLDVVITSQSNKKILYSKNITASSIDTVYLSDVQQLEDSSLPIKTIYQPRISFFDSIIEPAVITVASAVAIYLFFTIRS